MTYLNRSHPVWTIIACNLLKTAFHRLVLKEAHQSSTPILLKINETFLWQKEEYVQNLQQRHASDKVSDQYEVTGGLGVQGDDVVEVAALQP